MSKYKKFLNKVLSGQSDANIQFSELCKLLKKLGFEERVKGSHHIFYQAEISEILNIQPLPKGKAKRYQVKQIRAIIQKYSLGAGI